MSAKCVLALLVLALSMGLSGCGKAEAPAPPAPILQCKDPQILQRVTGILAEACKYPIEHMKSEMRLVEDLEVNGPVRVGIRMDLETAFGIKIHEDEIKKARTVSELAAFVEEKVKAKK